jgi:hypothetical protein
MLLQALHVLLRIVKPIAMINTQTIHLTLSSRRKMSVCTAANTSGLSMLSAASSLTSKTAGK